MITETAANKIDELCTEFCAAWFAFFSKFLRLEELKRELLINEHIEVLIGTNVVLIETRNCFSYRTEQFLQRAFGLCRWNRDECEECLRKRGVSQNRRRINDRDTPKSDGAVHDLTGFRFKLAGGIDYTGLD